MASQTQICNIALIDIGANTINSVSDGSVEGDTCSIIWDILLLEVLEAHTWNFAKKWDSLAQDAGYTMVDSAWDYAYSLPADYVRMSRMEDKAYNYEIRGNNLLFTADECNIEYIWKVTDTTKFPSHFVKALVARLRPALYAKLSGKNNVEFNWMNEYDKVLNNSKMLDGLSDNPTMANKTRYTQSTDTWLAART